jgi:hypothetical protein
MRRGADINAATDDGRTVLHCAALKEQLPVMQWLVAQGADINAATDNGSTPLHYAATEGSVAAMQWLVEEGADINAATDDGRTVLHFAAIKGRVAAMTSDGSSNKECHSRHRVAMVSPRLPVHETPIGRLRRSGLHRPRPRQQTQRWHYCSHKKMQIQLQGVDMVMERGGHQPARKRRATARNRRKLEERKLRPEHCRSKHCSPMTKKEPRNQ